jgi:hypothetical protein
MAAAREGNLYIVQGKKQAGPDDVHLLIEIIRKLSNAYEQLAQRPINNVSEETGKSQTKPIDNRVPSFDEMMQVFKKAKSKGLWNCKRSWGVGYQMWKIWGWEGTVLEYVHLVENSKEIKEFEYKCNQDAVYKMMSKGHLSYHLENWRKDRVLKRHCLLGEFINDELKRLYPPRSPKV